jgi:hypothetical protein
VKAEKKKSIPQFSDLSPMPSSDLVVPEEEDGNLQVYLQYPTVWWMLWLL